MIKLRRYQLNLKKFVSLLWIVGLVFCVASTQVHATTVTSYDDVTQTTTVTGAVVSAEDNMGIPGVNVLVKGTNTGAVTDFDGNYSIGVPSNAVLVFSYLGFVTQEITVGTNTTINVTLQPDLSVLDEVVVVGYGTARKETLTGSVEQVTSEAFEDLAVGSPALALQGRTPGLIVTRGSSRPGDEDINFNIRGVSSINGIDPLIVIDGVPALNSASFNEMNPNDIESISVLKGGSASVYGSRAAGGVVLVTTKKGKEGNVKIDVSSILRVGTIGIRPPTPTMSQYGQLYLDAATEDIASGISPNYFFWTNLETLERIAAGEEGIYNDLFIIGDVYLGNAGNRFDEMYGNSHSTQHNISLSGGTDKSHFRIAAGYNEDVGGLKVVDDTADRYNFSLNYGADISERLSINTNVTYFHKHVSGPSGGLDREAITYDAPLFPSRNPDGNWYANFGGNIAGNRNAVARVTDGGRTNEKDEQFRISASATYKITDDLNFVGSYSLSKLHTNDQVVAITVPQYNWFGDVSPDAINGQSYISELASSRTYKNYRGALNYSKSFGDHNVSGVLGIEAEKTIDESLFARRNGFEDYGVYDLNLGATDQAITTSGGGRNWGFYGYFARINYDYKGKYLFEAQGRRDGTSRFAEGSKWSSYGNISAGWVLTQEEFLKNSNIISFLKIRGGYGELGSTSGINDFGYLSSVGFGNTVFGSSAAYQITSSASNLFEPSTTWERVQSTEFGVDFKLFNSKVFGSVDLFKKVNKEMLIREPLPLVVAPNAAFTNAGTLTAKGWEVMLGWRDKIGDFDISVSANLSDSRNKATDFYTTSEDGGTPDDGVNLVDTSDNNAEEIIEGKPINAIYLWDTDGYFEDQAAVDAYYASLDAGGNLPSQTSSAALRPGDTRIIDTNGDRTIDEQDIVFKGDNTPHYNYGFNFDIKYKNWDLSAFFQGSLEHKIMRSGYFSRPFIRVWQNQSAAWLNRTWTADNPNAEFPRLTTNSTLSAWNYANKDFMLQNNKYIRLKSLIIGYNIKGLKVGKTNIDNLRVYFSGNDLWESTAVKDGYDPEFVANTNANSYPFMRTWAFGVNLSI